MIRFGIELVLLLTTGVLFNAFFRWGLGSWRLSYENSNFIIIVSLICYVFIRLVSLIPFQQSLRNEWLFLILIVISSIALHLWVLAVVHV